MFWDQIKNQNKYYDFVDRIEELENKMEILPINFQKPWWDIILRQKNIPLFTIFCQFLSSSFEVVFPILIAYSVTNLDFNLLAMCFAIWIAIIWLYNIMLRFDTIFQVKNMGSVEVGALKYFLTVDPINHSTKSSGQIISKVTRGASSYQTVLDVVIFDLVKIVTSLITVIIAMFAFGWQLGLVTLGFVLLIALIGIVLQIFRTKTFQPRRIKAEDKFKAMSVESMMQAPFIRVIFATNEQTKKASNTALKSMVVQRNSWQAAIYIQVIIRSLYAISAVIIGFMVLFQVKDGILTPVIATSVIVTYINSTSGVLEVGGHVKRLTEGLSNITDLFDFIRSFGKQSFPVLEENVKLKN
jgi:ABC-type multidrug transport system fused ATPase/permease subunit